MYLQNKIVRIVLVGEKKRRVERENTEKMHVQSIARALNG